MVSEGQQTRQADSSGRRDGRGRSRLPLPSSAQQPKSALSSAHPHRCAVHAPSSLILFLSRSPCSGSDGSQRPCVRAGTATNHGGTTNQPPRTIESQCCARSRCTGGTRRTWIDATQRPDRAVREQQTDPHAARSKSLIPIADIRSSLPLPLVCCLCNCCPALRCSPLVCRMRS